MTDLREKISDLLHEWRSDIIDETVAYDWGCHAKKPASTYDIAERIRALLPKLWWDGDKLKLGDLLVGWAYGSHDDNLYGGTTWSRGVVTDVSEVEARAAVEAAVRKALGWAE